MMAPTDSQEMEAPVSLSTRVNSILLDCGLNSDENLVSRGRQLAQYLGSQFVSVLAAVEEGELLVYGWVKTQSIAAVSRNSATQAFAATAANSAAAKPSLVSTGTEGHEKSDEVNEAPGGSTIYTSSGIAICFLMPFMTMLIGGFTYSAVSIYFRENDWPLWHLALAVFTSYSFQTVANVWVASQGAWLALPFCIVNLLSGISSIGSQTLSFWPYEYSEAVVVAQLVGMYGLQIDVAVQGLCFQRFSHDDNQLQKASRLLNLSQTVGYGTSPFVGGLLFDLGNWKLITIFHCIAASLIVFIVGSEPAMWQSLKSWREKRSRKSRATSIVPEEQEQDGEEQRKPSIWSRPEIARPVFLSGLAFLCCVWSYMGEWMLYAIYFWEQHGWNDATWAGIAQMAGDLGGAAVLVASDAMKKESKDDTGAEVSTEGTGSPRKSWWTTLTSRPYNLSFILLCWIICNIGMCSPNLKVSVAAQVVMGTVMVFGYQWTVEMNMFLAAGDDDTYLKLQAITGNVMSVGCAVAGPSALFLYETVHPLAHFLIAAAVCGAVLIIYTICFMCYPVGPPKKDVGPEEDNSVHAF